MTLVTGCAIVTGGGSGIGRAIAESIARAGGRASFAQADVSQWEEIDGVVAKLVAALGPLGILVNAAGILDGYAPVHEMSPALWTKVIAINLSGTFFRLQAGPAGDGAGRARSHHQSRVGRRPDRRGRRPGLR